MTKDLVPTVVGAINAGTVQGAGVAINTTNGAYIASVGVSDQLVILIDNTTVSAKNLTITAGAYPPAFRSGMGDLVIACTLSAKTWVFLESARFMQADGSIYLAFESGMTGTVFCVRIPPEAL